MKYNFLLIKFLFCLFLFSSCIEEIEFDVPKDYQNSTVITGKIVKGNPSVVEVRIQNLFDFSFEDVVYVRAQGVRVVNDRGQILEIPVTGIGVYSREIFSDSDFEVRTGGEYFVEVDLFNGKSFKSKAAKILPVPKMKSVDLNLFEKEVITFRDKKEIQPWIEYFISTDLNFSQNNEPINLKWEFQRTYKQTDNKGTTCYISREVSFDQISLVNTKSIGTPSLQRFPVLEQIVSSSIVEGQYVTFIQESLDEEAFKYWADMKDLSINSGTFYEPPPGKLITNFETTNNSEGSVFGYFYATEHDTLRAFVDASFIDQYRPVCPRLTPNPGVCDDCCDCETSLGSTTEKPSFWTN